MELNEAMEMLKDWVEIDRELREHDKGKEYHELDEYSQF